MSILQKSTQPTAPEVAYRWLRDEICSLPWDQEAFLSENAVAEASGTSRTPVREALLRLESAGLVKRVPHKGAYVPALSTADIDDMMEARKLIGEWAVRKMAVMPGSKEHLHTLLKEQEAVLDDPLKFIECDVQFHQYIVGYADNPILTDVYESLRFKQMRMGLRAVSDSHGRSEHVMAEHRAMVEAILSGDPEAAAITAVDHINSTQKALMESISRSSSPR